MVSLTRSLSIIDTLHTIFKFLNPSIGLGIFDMLLLPNTHCVAISRYVHKFDTCIQKNNHISVSSLVHIFSGMVSTFCKKKWRYFGVMADNFNVFWLQVHTTTESTGDGHCSSPSLHTSHSIFSFHLIHPHSRTF
jgi:hypothetical protein